MWSFLWFDISRGSNSDLDWISYAKAFDNYGLLTLFHIILVVYISSVMLYFCHQEMKSSYNKEIERKENETHWDCTFQLPRHLKVNYPFSFELIFVDECSICIYGTFQTAWFLRFHPEFYHLMICFMISWLVLLRIH